AATDLGEERRALRVDLRVRLEVVLRGLDAAAAVALVAPGGDDRAHLRAPARDHRRAGLRDVRRTVGAVVGLRAGAARRGGDADPEEERDDRSHGTLT